ncbi:hypothetical protein DID80_06290 [Candidatus Marinamargulisbacteria bacterium SCGC AAA071-K20]|nr:hypothetical protein DID80_06290 [Candidatus Marinamargulisbacteria bacterium SCGC AAA071-K20]
MIKTLKQYKEPSILISLALWAFITISTTQHLNSLRAGYFNNIAQTFKSISKTKNRTVFLKRTLEKKNLTVVLNKDVITIHTKEILKGYTQLKTALIQLGIDFNALQINTKDKKITCVLK